MVKVVVRVLGWLIRPQALVGFAVLCLSVGAAGGLLRSTPAGSVDPTLGNPMTKRATHAPDCHIKACLALTFDDGPNPVITPQILDILARQQVKATFFVVGMRVPGQEALLRREYQDGHEIGNHSWSHPDLSKMSPEEAQEQIELTQKVISSAGVPAPKILRPPYGAVNDMVAAHSNLTIVRWNADPVDWSQKDPAKVTQLIVASARPGAIILLHDIHPTTVTGLEAAIQTLKQQYQLVTATQLLGVSPGDQGQFFARYR